MNGYHSIDWAEVVDLFASEYGWTIVEIGKLDMSQISSLMDAMKKRYDRQNGDGSRVGEPSQSTEDLDIENLEKEIGGKRVVRDDGTVEVII